MALNSGTKLGPYEIRNLLGEGGMGEVYRARDTRLQRDVAIKVLPHTFARDAERLRRFEQEARAVAALNHPNLLTVFDVGTMELPEGAQTETVPYLVSELLEGASLRERLASGPLPERKAIDNAVQIARGLAAAHERGIIHRDIKPENIFVTNDGRVKILDFGLAKLVESPSGNETIAETQAMHTHAGMVMGTVGYMAPEQLRGKPVDARSDIFSLGAVLYEMLSGKKAFSGDSSADVMSAILNKEPAEFDTATLSVSPALDHIIRRCLEKDPVQRFQSAGDLAFALQELSGIRSSTQVSGMMAIPEMARPSWRRWIIPAGALAALIAAVLVTWHVASSRAYHDPPKYTQLTYQQGFVRNARFLHDGHTFLSASRWGFEPKFGLHVGSLDTVGLRSLDTPAESLCSVSSKDDVLLINGFHSLGPGYVTVGTLYVMHYGGGAPRPLMDNVQYADWNPDGSKFAVVRFDPEKHAYSLEYPVGTVLYQTEGWISDPRFSRDGQRIAFLDHPLFGDDQGSAAVVDLNGKVKKFGDKVFGSTQNVVWSPDGNEIWFSGAETGVARSLWAVDLSGRYRALLTAPGDMDIQDVLPDGKALVSDLSQRRVQMIVTPDHPEERDFTWMDWAYGQRFSSDGKQLLFGDQHSSDNYGAFLRNVDGSPAVRLGDGDPFDVSPDGKYAISRVPTGAEQLYLLPTGTGDPRQLTHTKIQFAAARFITNDRIMGYGNQPGHKARSFDIDLQGNVKPLTPEGVAAYAFTPDGKRMLVGEAFKNLRVIPVDGGPETPVKGVADDEFVLDFNNDGSTLYVDHTLGSNRVELWQVDYTTGKRTLIHTVTTPGIPAISFGVNATISRDGKSYAYEYHPALSTEYLIEGLR